MRTKWWKRTWLVIPDKVFFCKSCCVTAYTTQKHYYMMRRSDLLDNGQGRGRNSVMSWCRGSHNFNVLSKSNSDFHPVTDRDQWSEDLWIRALLLIFISLKNNSINAFVLLSTPFLFLVMPLYPVISYSVWNSPSEKQTSSSEGKPHII